MEHFIPLSVPNLKGNEIDYVTRALKSEWVSTAGSFISDFELSLANYVGVSNAVACQSGTAGLHLALIATGIGNNQEVIVPTLTFIAAVNPVKYVGAEPIFMDCDDSLTLDSDKLREFCELECEFTCDKLINKRTKKHIAAIIVVHIFGNIADMESINDIAKKYNLILIEDATEALGSYYLKGKCKDLYAGTIGDIGVYSFNGNKIITTGGGGMIVSNNKQLLERCRYLSTQAKNDSLYFEHDEVGYNYRMTNIQAALGLAQLEQLETFIQIKSDNYMEYKKHDINLIDFRNDIRPNYWFYSYLTDDRDKLMSYLNDKNIQTRPVWKLIHTLKPYLDCQCYKIEKAIYYYNKILNLPCSSNLSTYEIGVVASEINNFSL